MAGMIECWVPEGAAECRARGGGWWGVARAARAVRLRIKKQGGCFFVSFLIYLRNEACVFREFLNVFKKQGVRFRDFLDI